jgi:hypothetical protein
VQKHIRNNTNIIQKWIFISSAFCYNILFFEVNSKIYHILNEENIYGVVADIFYHSHCFADAGPDDYAALPETCGAYRLP